MERAGEFPEDQIKGTDEGCQRSHGDFFADDMERFHIKHMCQRTDRRRSDTDGHEKRIADNEQAPRHLSADVVRGFLPVDKNLNHPVQTDRSDDKRQDEPSGRRFSGCGYCICLHTVPFVIALQTGLSW